MKKLLIALIITFNFFMPALAITPMANLAIIENNLFGYENKQTPELQRLDKIEKTIYGTTQKNSLPNRLKKINTDLGLDLDDYNGQNTENTPQVADASANYPIIDKMEKSLFKKTYQTENVYKRLDRLEVKAFGAASNRPLNTRVDKLSQKIQVENTSDYNNITETSDYNYYTTEEEPETALQADPNKTFAIQQPMPAGLNFTLNSIEKSSLGKTYPQETNNARLTRLEDKLLKKTFQSEDEKTRLERLSAIQEARKTSKNYDSNKWSRTLNTGMQIGGILLMILTMLI